MPLFTLESLISAIITGYFARDLKLHMKSIKKNKKRLYILGFASVLSYIGNFLFYYFVTKDIGVLVWDMVFPAVASLTLYFTTHGDREKYDLTQKLKAIPEVKKANRYFMIFLVCYVLSPVIAFAIYSYLTGNNTIHFSNEESGIFLWIVIAYVTLFFVACISSFKTYKKHYLTEISKTIDERTK